MAGGLTGAELGREMGVDRSRVSQWVREGKLAGCYAGEGRARRFDLARCREALGRNLDRSQMLGNGAATKRALERTGEEPRQEAGREAGAGATGLPSRDPDRYELARTLKAEEEARRLRRQNLVEEKSFLLASETELEVRRLIGREVAEFETVIRDGARAVADRLGVDYREARAILLETWRAHRGARSATLSAEAEGATMTAAEIAADV